MCTYPHSCFIFAESILSMSVPGSGPPSLMLDTCTTMSSTVSTISSDQETAGDNQSQLSLRFLTTLTVTDNVQ